jgi:16S rRNA (adenine1518-N6/adenine1519-N6)-dimethyltransferase
MRQPLGQHFLTNESVLQKIAGALDVRPGEIIVEIGPGHGELTEHITALAGAENVILLERDPLLAAALRENTRAKIVEGDVLETLPHLAASFAESQPYKLAGNLPYYLTGFLLRTISELGHKPVRSIFTIQKEVAERLVQKPPHMNRLAAAVQFWADPSIIGFISRKDFSPPPEVDSATIELRTKKDLPGSGELRSYEAALHAIFQQPRKTLVNNLLSFAALSRAELVEKLRALGIDPESRPQNLSVQDIVRIGKSLANWG